MPPFFLARVALALADRDARVGVEQMHKVEHMALEEEAVVRVFVGKVHLEPLRIDELAEALFVVFVERELLHYLLALVVGALERAEFRVHLVSGETEHGVHHTHGAYVVVFT